MLRKVLLAMVVLWLGLMGVLTGLLCLFCMILLIFWQGLGVGTVLLAFVSLICLGLAFVFARLGTDPGSASPATIGSGWFSQVWQRLFAGAERKQTLDADGWDFQFPDNESWDVGAKSHDPRRRS